MALAIGAWLLVFALTVRSATASSYEGLLSEEAFRNPALMPSTGRECPGLDVPCALAELELPGCPTGDIRCGSSALGTLQRWRGRPAASAARPTELCPLVGRWLAHDALGYEGVTVVLTVAPAVDGACDSLDATLEYPGQKLHYVITVEEEEDDDFTFHVKYSNLESKHPYYHEGAFDARDDALTEDICSVNGGPRSTEPGCGVLKFERD